jgi:hypothetical protein
MRYFATFIICLSAISVHAQSITYPAKPNFYVYNNQKDTIHFSKVGVARGFQSSTFKVVDSIQIDGSGVKELVFLREGSSIFSDHGGTFDITGSTNFSKYEIWNLDTKTLLFEANCGWSEKSNGFDARRQPSRQNVDIRYKYDFSINASGTIIIDNFCGTQGAKPDHNIGTYMFKNGKYIKAEPQ